MNAEPSALWSINGAILKDVRDEFGLKGMGKGAMNVRAIVEAHLKSIGADGLCMDECGCRISGLAPCGELSSECVPAVRAKCDEECDRCEGSGCMVPMPENGGI